jgi:sporulation integral membrane protein YlbJ
MIYLLAVIIVLILLLIYELIRDFANKSSLMGKILLTLCIITFTVAVILYPKDSFEAAGNGLKTWFNIVCPSLLPFFIGSELLISLGVVDFTGVLLEPVMRPLFNVPGCGSFPFVMSITSGYPVGSRIVSNLLKNNSCTMIEAQRMLSFCSTSGPLFMIGAVAVGMLNIKGVGSIIIISHYLGAITAGIAFRFYRYGDKPYNNTIAPKVNILKKAFRSLLDAYMREKRPFGLMLSESVIKSVNTLLLIGGIIVLFSVIIKILALTGVLKLFSNLLLLMLSPFDIQRNLLEPISSSIFEITIGSKMIASSHAEISQKIIALSGIISWSGLSIHAQVAGMISGTNLKMTIYIAAKLLHSILSCFYAYIIISFKGVSSISEETIETFLPGIIPSASSGWTSTMATSSLMFIRIFLIMLLASVVYITAYNIYQKLIR